MPKGVAPPRRQKSTRQKEAQNAAIATAGAVPLEQIARRKKRHLDELERSNYTEPKFSLIGEEVDTENGGGTARDRVRVAISDKKRKSTAGVRRILLYRKSHATWVEEFASSTARKPGEVAYTTVTAPPPSTPRRPFCSVCGYWGNYACQKCGMHYCTLPCRATHEETRCEQRIF